MSLVGLVVGDGHGRTEQFTYDVNVDRAALERAFDDGSEIIGFHLDDECCGYEDSVLSKDACDKVQAHFPDSDLAGYIRECNGDGDHFHIEACQYAGLYLMIAQLGNHGITYTSAPIETVDVGGYGLA